MTGETREAEGRNVRSGDLRSLVQLNLHLVNPELRDGS